ncbi:MAG TPA: DUF3618 domain-containing protein [Natronosporangium sp.]|nr:DUF3618 domain-containing protein [Natronosporangium sp.]
MNRALSERQAEALRDDIIRTRADLGRTVRVLAERADLRARARASTDRYRQRARAAGDRLAARAGEAARTPGFWLLVGSLAGAAVAVLAARGGAARRWVRRMPVRPDPGDPS